MRVLILGGTGAMGISLVQLLKEDKNDVYVTSRGVHESQGNLHYIQGNAHNIDFLKQLLVERYDVIVDFMKYSTEEFSQRVNLFLESTRQYIFLSSSRVYSDTAEERISEDTPRLLDVPEMAALLPTGEYALAKAEQENILLNSKYSNWTIIRPYITYNDARLQLGVLEKEQWLYRAIRGKKIVLGKDVAECWTTLTHGEDVARAIINLMNNSKCLRQVYHIAGAKPIKWKEVLEIYSDTLKKITGKEIEVHWVDSSEKIARITGPVYQLLYDRLYKRVFDNTKVDQLNNIIYIEPKDGLSNCLTNFINRNLEFRKISLLAHAYMDRLTGEHMSLSEIASLEQRMKYVLWRYTPILDLRYELNKFLKKF